MKVDGLENVRRQLAEEITLIHAMRFEEKARLEDVIFQLRREAASAYDELAGCAAPGSVRERLRRLFVISNGALSRPRAPGGTDLPGAGADTEENTVLADEATPTKP